MTAFAIVVLPQPDSPASPRIAGADVEVDAVDRAEYKLPCSTTSPRSSSSVSVRVGAVAGWDSIIGVFIVPERAFARGGRAPSASCAAAPRSAAGVADSSMPASSSTSPRTVNASAAPGKKNGHHWPCSTVEFVLRPVEGHAPARLGHVAEPEELEPGVGEERDVEDEHERRRDPADHVRHQLAEDDAAPRLAGGFRGQDEVAVLRATAPARAGCAPRTPRGRARSRGHDAHAGCPGSPT